MSLHDQVGNDLYTGDVVPVRRRGGLWFIIARCS